MSSQTQELQQQLAAERARVVAMQDEHAAELKRQVAAASRCRSYLSCARFRFFPFRAPSFAPCICLVRGVSVRFLTFSQSLALLFLLLARHAAQGCANRVARGVHAPQFGTGAHALDHDAAANAICAGDAATGRLPTPMQRRMHAKAHARTHMQRRMHARTCKGACTHKHTHARTHSHFRTHAFGCTRGFSVLSLSLSLSLVPHLARPRANLCCAVCCSVLCSLSPSLINLTFALFLSLSLSLTPTISHAFYLSHSLSFSFSLGRRTRTRARCWK
jgi:hypothetical protein